MQLQTEKKNCWATPRAAPLLENTILAGPTMDHTLDKRNDCWMPTHHIGLQLLTKGIPDINKLVKVPYKQVDTEGLCRTLFFLTAYLKDEQTLWWNKTIEKLDTQFSRYFAARFISAFVPLLMLLLPVLL